MIRVDTYIDRMSRLHIAGVFFSSLTSILMSCAISTLMQIDSSTRTKSHSFKLHKESNFNTNKFKYFFTNIIINRWNGLPEHVVTAESLNVFKNKLDKHWEHLKFCTNFTNEGVEG